MRIFFSTDQVSAVGLGGTSEINVGLQVVGLRLSVDASTCVPGIISLNVFNAVNEIRTSGHLSLSQVLGLAELI